MKTILKMIAGILLFVAVGLAIVLFVVPANSFKPMIESAASDALGRPVAIDGDLNWRLWPPLSVELSGLRITNLPDREPPNMVVAEKAHLDIDALAYFSGKLDLTKLTLERPIVHLSRNGEGVANWEFGATGTEAPTASDDAVDEEGGALPELRLGQIAISDGEFTFVDEQAGLRHHVEALNVSLTEEVEGLVAKAAASYNERDVNLDASIGAFNALAAGQSSEIEVKIVSPFFEVGLDGKAAESGIEAASLLVNLDDVAALLSWLQLDAELPADVPNSIALTAQLDAKPELLNVSELNLVAAPFEISGNIDVELLDRPKILAILNAGAIDLSPFMGGTGDVTEAQEVASPAISGWPDEPIALPLPLPLDLDVTTSFASIKAGELQTGSGALQIYADSLAARVDVSDLELYNGMVAIGLSIQEFGEAPRIALQSEIEQVQAGPLLAAVAEFDRLAGATNLQADIQTQGGSIKAMVEAAQGQGNFLFRDGAVLGVNIAGTLRSIASLGLNPEAGGEKRTDFAEMGGSFVIQNGTLSNDDFQLRAPVLRIQGAGTVDMPEQSLDYAVTPRLSATLEGQDAEAEPAIGAGIPLVFSGPWSDPQIQLAIGGTLSGDLRDPQALAGLVGQLGSDPEQLLKLREQFGVEGSALDSIGSLLGGDGDESPIPPIEDAEEAIEDLKDQVDELKEGLGGLLQR